MKLPRDRAPGLLAILTPLLICASLRAQVPEGPQSDAPPPATTPAPAAPRPAAAGQTIIVPAGTRIGVILESGISTATAKPGDSVYFRTSFPITISNKVVVPVSSYLRGEVLESKRPGHVKGKGALRIRLNTLIFPNGYTVDMNAEPRGTDAAKVKTDEEGKMTGPGGKGKDAASTVTTVATTAGAGSIIGGLGSDSAKGAAIGAGIGGAAGLAAILLSRGPEAQLPRGSSLDLLLERDLYLDADQIHYPDVGHSDTIILQQPPPSK
jgi:type IV secretion system protein VirB10